MKNFKWLFVVVLAVMVSGLMLSGCKRQTEGRVFPVAALNVVNALPNSAPLILVQGLMSSTIGNFSNIGSLAYGSTAVLTPISGSEAIYAVQSNADTASIDAKGGDFMFNDVLSFKAGGIYSLFITGADTTSPDFLFLQDTLAAIVDSAVGIRFVNLSTGAGPMSINLEGSASGSEVSNLTYKGITRFREYASNSTTIDYIFVVRDATTGDSLTKFDFLAIGSSNNGNGLTDPSNSQNNGTLLTFKHITIAVYGSESVSSTNPLSTMVIDNY